MANKLTHTPGPWFLEGNWNPEAEAELGGWVSCFPPAGVPVFELTPVVGKREEICANARLIAAAPEMLEALQKIVDMNVQYAIDRFGDASQAESMSCVTIARAAIAKATGHAALNQDGGA